MAAVVQQDQTIIATSQGMGEKMTSDLFNRG